MFHVLSKSFVKDWERERERVKRLCALVCLSMLFAVLYIGVKGPLKLMADDLSWIGINAITSVVSCQNNFVSLNNFFPIIVSFHLRLKLPLLFLYGSPISESAWLWESLRVLMMSSDDAESFWNDIPLFRVRTSRVHSFFRCFWYSAVLLRVRTSWACFYFRCFWSSGNLYLIWFCIWWRNQIPFFLFRVLHT